MIEGLLHEHKRLGEREGRQGIRLVRVVRAEERGKFLRRNAKQ